MLLAMMGAVTKRIGTHDQLLSYQWGAQSVEIWSRLQDTLARVGSLAKTKEPQTYFDDRFTRAVNQFDRNKMIAFGEGQQ